MDIDTRKDLFRRLNEGVKLEAQQKRKGAFAGLYYDFISKLATGEEFKKLCPFSNAKLDKEKHVEFINKFFTYSESSYTGKPTKMLDDYMQTMLQKEEEDEQSFNKKLQEQEDLFNKVLNIVKKHIGSFALGDNKSVSGQRFEGISIGIALALKEVDFDENQLSTEKLSEFVKSPEFIERTTIAGGSNNTINFESRVNSIKSILLNK